MIIVRKAREKFLHCYCKRHKNALLRRNSHEFGSVKLQFWRFEGINFVPRYKGYF